MAMMARNSGKPFVVYVVLGIVVLWLAVALGWMKYHRADTALPPPAHQAR